MTDARNRSTSAVPSRGSVLVVDDDADIRELMTDLLGAAGYDVSTAQNGADALRCLHARATLPGVILLDVEMPVMDGRAFLAERAKEAILGAIPVVVTSATATPLEGAQAFVRKPVDVARLLGLVESYCAVKKARKTSN